VDQFNPKIKQQFAALVMYINLTKKKKLNGVNFVHVQFVNHALLKIDHSYLHLYQKIKKNLVV